MAVKSVHAVAASFEILTSGAHVRLLQDGSFAVSQLIGGERQLIRGSLPAHLSPWRLIKQTPFACELAGCGLKLTVQGDSVLIFEPQQHIRPAYRMLRAARELLGDRILYLHSSTEPFGTARVYPPFAYAYADYVLSGEAGRFDLALDNFLRFSVGQYQISNAVGLWCYYGSMGLPGYHSNVPTSEHIAAALRNHARIWRQGAGWSSHPEELARFDREYYGKLSKDAG
ncbi:MAG: hypothetical protein HYV35_00280 [Lentisphaerae bacterium]|nr:hypothetical protein [Lentisphaerota bacterium]